MSLLGNIGIGAKNMAKDGVSLLFKNILPLGGIAAAGFGAAALPFVAALNPLATIAVVGGAMMAGGATGSHLKENSGREFAFMTVGAVIGFGLAAATGGMSWGLGALLGVAAGVGTKIATDKVSNAPEALFNHMDKNRKTPEDVQAYVDKKITLGLAKEADQDLYRNSSSIDTTAAQTRAGKWVQKSQRPPQEPGLGNQRL
jgi:hypothetical protein